MVRATRSQQVVVEHPTLAETVPPMAPAKKTTSKKRKRTSDADDATLISETNHESSPDQEKPNPPSGESEHDGDKEEPKERPAGKRQKTATKQVAPKEESDSTLLPPRHQDGGSLPMSSADAESLLSVLEAIDTDAFLDRELDLSSPYIDSSLPEGTTVRQLLKESSSHSIRTVQTAVKALLYPPPPPRTAISDDYSACEQFCDITLGLLRQVAEKQGATLDGTRTTLDADVEDSSKGITDSGDVMDFALHQQLPSGDFFTSATKLTPKEASELITGQASLVAVQPTVLVDPAYMPKLGSYSRGIRPIPMPQYRLPVSRRVAAGSTLDYGPFASFAPVYDSEAAELTEQDLCDLMWSKRRRIVERRRINEMIAESNDIQMEDAPTTPAEPVIDPALGLEDDVREALEQLQLESGIDDLLAKNAAAMQKLVGLQNARYRIGEHAPPVEVGGEEWNLAQALTRSLASLVSLRPRQGGSSSAPIIPHTSILRALQRTLPVDPTPGWKGTLARDPDVAYRDNVTITPGSTPYVNPTPAAPVVSRPAAPTATPSYPQYPQYQARPGLPATTSSYYAPHTYYPSYGAPATPSTAGKTPTTPAQPYYYHAYPQYPGYMQGQMYTQAATYGQPQPATPGQPPRAIPNMAKPASPYVNGWAAQPSASATLPPHLRKTTVGQPGTPVTPGYPQAGSASPVYPPAMASGYGAGYSGWPQPQAQPTKP